jgi:hypothetical protein
MFLPAYAPTRLPSSPASRIPPHKCRQNTSRSQFAEATRRDVGDTTRGPGEVVRRSEVEYAHHRLDGVPWIAEQLGGTCHAGEVDDPLQVGSSSRPELARQVLPADPKPSSQCGGAHGALYLAYQNVPGRLLERFSESQHPWCIDQSSAALRGNRRTQYEVAHHGIIHPLDDDARDVVATARD